MGKRAVHERKEVSKWQSVEEGLSTGMYHFNILKNCTVPVGKDKVKRKR
jgi:hypothetical protein